MLIAFARKIKTTGVNQMDFNVFDTTKMAEYTKSKRTVGTGNRELFELIGELAK